MATRTSSARTTRSRSTTAERRSAPRSPLASDGPPPDWVGGRRRSPRPGPALHGPGQPAPATTKERHRTFGPLRQYVPAVGPRGPPCWAPDAPRRGCGYALRTPPGGSSGPHPPGPGPSPLPALPNPPPTHHRPAGAHLRHHLAQRAPQQVVNPAPSDTPATERQPPTTPGEYDGASATPATIAAPDPLIRLNTPDRPADAVRHPPPTAGPADPPGSRTSRPLACLNGHLDRPRAPPPTPPSLPAGRWPGGGWRGSSAGCGSKERRGPCS